MITQTIEKINISDYDIAAGDLANEIGKIFLPKLQRSIEKHAFLKLDKIYFITTIRKDPTSLDKIHIVIQPLMAPLHYMRESMDHWVYDYKKEKLDLIWSLPHRTEMKNFLRCPEKYSLQMLEWIQKYLDQEKINLKDKSSKIIK